MTVTLTKHIGEIYISFEGETAAEVVELYRGYRDVEAAHAVIVSGAPAAEPDEVWIEWGGGICPIAPLATLADLKLRDGQIRRAINPHDFVWRHPANPSSDELDIVAYRVVS